MFNKVQFQLVLWFKWDFSCLLIFISFFQVSFTHLQMEEPSPTLRAKSSRNANLELSPLWRWNLHGMQIWNWVHFEGEIFMECKFGTESALKVKSSRNANLELSPLWRWNLRRMQMELCPLLKVEILKRNVQYPTYFLFIYIIHSSVDDQYWLLISVSQEFKSPWTLCSRSEPTGH